MTTKTPRDPESFAWGDLCDIYGTPYHLGDQYRTEAEADGILPDFSAALGPTTLLWLEAPPDDETETDYITGRPLEPLEAGGGWTHYKLRELTVHLGTRVPPAEVLRMIRAGIEAGSISAGAGWVDKAVARVVELTGPDLEWLDA